MATEENSWKQFPENLGAWDESPPPELWSQLEAMLDAPSPKGKVRKFRPGWWGAGLLLLLIPAAYFYFSGKPQNENLAHGNIDPLPLNIAVDSTANPAPDTAGSIGGDTLNLALQPLPVPPVVRYLEGEDSFPFLGRGLPRGSDDPITNIDPYIPIQSQWIDSIIPRTRQDSLIYYTQAPFPDLNANQQVVNRAFNSVFQNGNWNEQQAPVLSNYQNQMSYTPRNAFNPTTTTTISDLNWLLGSWKRMGPSGAAFEEWKRVDKYTLTGRGFFVINGDTTITDRMQIREMPDGLYYIVAVDTNRQSHKYRLRHTGPGNAVFQTESNDNEYRIEFLAPNDQELNVTRNRHHGPGLGTETQKMSREGPAVDAYGEPPKKGGKTKKGN